MSFFYSLNKWSVRGPKLDKSKVCCVCVNHVFNYIQKKMRGKVSGFQYTYCVCGYTWMSNRVYRFTFSFWRQRKKRHIAFKTKWVHVCQNSFFDVTYHDSLFYIRFLVPSEFEWNSVLSSVLPGHFFFFFTWYTNNQLIEQRDAKKKKSYVCVCVCIIVCVRECVFVRV